MPVYNKIYHNGKYYYLPIQATKPVPAMDPTDGGSVGKVDVSKIFDTIEKRFAGLNMKPKSGSGIIRFK